MMKLLVTAGPTREFMDPVRFLSNPSSGKMGFAVGEVALGRGHEVQLVTGPVALSSPQGIERIDVVSAAEMLDAVATRVPWCDALVMTAAVADWKPRDHASAKVKKSGEEKELLLVRTKDVLREVAALKGKRIFVGFAAETEDPVAEARRKLCEKGLDLVVANNVLEAGAGFEADTNRVTFVGPDGYEEALPLLTKTAVAERILDWIEQAGEIRDGS